MVQFSMMVNDLTNQAGFLIELILKHEFAELILYTSVLIAVQSFQFYKKDQMAILKIPSLLRAMFYFVCFYLMLIYGVSGGKEFIYFQF